MNKESKAKVVHVKALILESLANDDDEWSWRATHGTSDGYRIACKARKMMLELQFHGKTFFKEDNIFRCGLFKGPYVVAIRVGVVDFHRQSDDWTVVLEDSEARGFGRKVNNLIHERFMRAKQNKIDEGLDEALLTLSNFDDL